MQKFAVCGTGDGRPKPTITTSSKPSKNRIDVTNVQQWTKEQVAIWLTDIGYDEFVNSFLQNDVDGMTLLEFTKQDFDDIYINSVGKRKAIERHINQLREASNYTPKKSDMNDNQPSKNMAQQQQQPSPQQQNSRNNIHASPYDNPLSSTSHQWRPSTNNNTQELMRDKNTYWQLWERLIGRQELMARSEYDNLMARSGIASETCDEMWRTINGSRSDRCGFEQFGAMMKLTHIVQSSSLPLFLIALDRLSHYHPALPNFSSPQQQYAQMQRLQATQNMIAFRGIPMGVLESDDRLMELEKHALRSFAPIHFEINSNVLIATFRTHIDPTQLEALRMQTRNALLRMGYQQHQLSALHLSPPNTTELGATPGGPADFNTPGGPPGASPGAPYGSPGVPPPPQPDYRYPPTSMNPYLNPNNDPNTVNNNGYQPTYHKNGGLAPPQQHNNQQMNSTATVALEKEKSGSANPPVAINKSEMQRLANSEDFWREFCLRVNMQQLHPERTEKVRTRVAMTMVARLRGVPAKQVNFSDLGVRVITGKTEEELEQKLKTCSLQTIADLLGIDVSDIPEMYKGIVIEGLPEDITNDDDKIRELDSHVLSSFKVSHIEVVDSLLRITFSRVVTQGDIDKLRKLLKSFLRDELRIDKKIMRNVAIVPHTPRTWKGEKTSSEIEQFSGLQYGVESQPNY